MAACWIVATERTGQQSLSYLLPGTSGTKFTNPCSKTQIAKQTINTRGLWLTHSKRQRPFKIRPFIILPSPFQSFWPSCFSDTSYTWPQGLCLGCSFILECSSPCVCTTHSFISFMFVLNLGTNIIPRDDYLDHLFNMSVPTVPPEGGHSWSNWPSSLLFHSNSHLLILCLVDSFIMSMDLFFPPE